MIRFVLILIIVFQSLSTKGLQVDSLYNVLPSLEGIQKINALNKLAEEDFENKAKLAKEALSLAEKIDYQNGIAKSLELLGVHAYENQEFENSLKYYKKSNHAFKELNDPHGRLRTLKGLNETALNLNRYDEVIDYCLQMEHLADSVDDKSHLAFSYARHGRIKGEIMKDTEGLREYSFKAADLYYEINEKESLSALYSNIAISYYIDQQFDSTMHYLNKGIVIGKELNQKRQLHILYSMSSELHYKMKDYETALEYSKLALSISLGNERKDVVSFDNLLIGKIYIAKEQYDTALNYINIGIKIAKDIGKLEQVAAGYSHLSQIYKGKNDLKKSIEYLELASELKDTISKNSLSLSIAEREAEFQMQLKQQELQTLEKTVAQQRLFRNGIIIIGVLVIFILALFINRYNVVMRFQKEELDRLRTIKQLEEKEKMLLKDKLLQKEKMLASNTMHIIQKNKILSDLKSEITNLPIAKNGENLKKKVKKINRAIETNMTYEDDWQNFKFQFEQVHPHFFSKLQEQFSNLGNNEIRFCAYIKMGHNTKEIAQLMGINASSVQKARYRLKKKMELEKSINLIDFIQKI